MRKYELYIAFTLALILMFLASCRSKQVTINEQVDSVSVCTMTLADIRSQMLDFRFDSMEIVVVDTCREVEGKVKSYKVKVMGGRIRAESNELRAERSETKDSVKVKSEYHEEKIMKTSKSYGLFWGILVLIALSILLGAYLCCIGKNAKDPL